MVMLFVPAGELGMGIDDEFRKKPGSCVKTFSGI